MDFQEKQKVEYTKFAICADEKCDGGTHIVDECVKCLRLFCPEHIWLTPRGNACVDCYPALHPEAMFGETLNWLSKLH